MSIEYDAGAKRAVSRSTKALVGFLVLLGGIYLAMPFFAGIWAIGDRRGPKIYPEGVHHSLYLMGWEMAEHEGKPRVSISLPPRPWFYGL